MVLMCLSTACGPEAAPSQQARPTSEEIADGVEALCDTVRRCPEEGAPVDAQVQECEDAWTDVMTRIEDAACVSASLEYMECLGGLSCENYALLAGQPPADAPYCLSHPLI